MWLTSRLEPENSCRAARVAPCALDPRSFLSHSFRSARSAPLPPSSTTPLHVSPCFIRKYTSARSFRERATREIRDYGRRATFHLLLYFAQSPALSLWSRAFNRTKRMRPRVKTRNALCDAIRSRDSKCARGGAWRDIEQEMSQVTDGQVKEKKKKRDSLMLFRPLVRCVGRPFPACQRGIRVRSYRFEKRCACFPGEGGKGEEKFKNEGRNEPRRGETLVKFYSIPPSPRERNSIVLPRLFANRINKQRKIQEGKGVCWSVDF